MKKNIILLIIVILLAFTGVIWGSHTLSIKSLVDSPIAELRFIRMISAFFIGGSLALSGLVFQSLLRNVLAEPFTLGISGGAGFYFRSETS